MSAFVDHCLELLAPLGAARSRRMFGGYGLYVDDLFLAIVAGERLYLKTDEDAVPHFKACGCEPFVYDAANKRVALGYWSAPEEAMESPALMQPWARLALRAALRGRQTAAPRSRATRATRTIESIEPTTAIKATKASKPPHDPAKAKMQGGAKRPAARPSPAKRSKPDPATKG